MLAVSFEPALQTPRFKSLNQTADFRIREHRSLERLNVVYIAPLKKNAFRDSGFEFRIAHKADDPVKFFLRNMEQFGQRANMPVVLTKRILEAELLFVIHLRPLTIISVGKNPALIVFGFDHKDAEF